MNYHNITYDDMLNGKGLRVVLWLSGCSHKCEGCHNPETWNKDSGILFDENAKQEIFNQLEKDYIDGITLSGGDPLFKENASEILSLVQEIKQKFPNKTIWLYTGYTWFQVKSYVYLRKIVEFVDVLVDGKFDKNLVDTQCKWRGSTNQNIIDVQKSLKSHKIYLVGGN